MSVFNVFLVLMTGVIAGFLNVVGGGGSLLTLPLLVFIGLPMPVANATNRIGIFLQNIIASSKFKKEGVLSLREAGFFALPAVLGAFLGTFLAIQLNEKILQIVIAVLISIMACLLVFKPRMWESDEVRDVPKWVLAVIFFFIGIYGGFVQAGVGFFFIWALVGVAGRDLLHSNAIKVTVICAYTVISLIMFITKGMVNIPIGLLLACGMMAGGYMGARFSVAKGNRWLRWILAGVVFLCAFRMIYGVFS